MKNEYKGRFAKYVGIAVLVFLVMAYIAGATTTITDLQIIVGNITLGPDEIQVGNTTIGESINTTDLNASGVIYEGGSLLSEKYNTTTEHGAEKHTNVTRFKIFRFDSAWRDAAPWTGISYGMMTASTFKHTEVYAEMTFPDDFVSLDDLYVVIWHRAVAGSIKWFIYQYQYAQMTPSSSLPGYTDSGLLGSGVITTTLQNAATYEALPSIKNDFLAAVTPAKGLGGQITFTRRGDLDAFADDIMLWGVVMIYTAEQ